MLLTLVIILILVGSAVVGSLYSNFLVFYSGFSEAENYHKAYYASVAAIERAELVIKQREPGFEGNGGWIKSESTGSYHNGVSSDSIPNAGFSYLSKNFPAQSTLHRNIKSQTDRIPSLSGGNVDKLLSSGDSLNYNMMDYENSEIFLMYYDTANSNSNPYNKNDVNISQSKPSSVKVNIRLPLRLRENFGDLDTSHSLVVQAGGFKDDAIVDWQLKGEIESAYNTYTPFTIFATQRAVGERSNVDSAIREGDLNQPSGAILTYDDTSRNPRNLNDSLTIISSKDEDIAQLPNKFKDIFGNSKNLQLRFSLLNIAQGLSGDSAKYPFLEYYVDFSGATVSDKYFTIQTEGNFGDYQIDTVIFKPTITESVLRSFTTIL